MVRRWQLDFSPPLAIVSLTLAWIRLPGLSIVYYDDNALHAISSCIGNFMKIDFNTALAIHGKFVRISMEVDLTKPLILGVMLEGH